MKRLPSRNVYLTALAVGLAFAALAWAMRTYGGYPTCPNDETNWIEIARQLDTGAHWPVSGPAFIELVRLLSNEINIKHAQAL